MKIALMRKLDYWLGIPLCFILSGINLFLKLFGIKAKKATKPNNILFIKPSEIGSIILSCPLIQQVKEEHKDSRLFFLTFQSNKDLLKVLAIIPTENIIEINDKSFFGFIIDTVKAVSRMHKENIDTTIDLEFFSRFTSIISYLSGASRRVGFYKYSFEGLYKGTLLTHRIQYNPQIHISSQFLSFSQPLNCSNKISPDLQLTPDISKYILPIFNANAEQTANILNKLSKFKVENDSMLFLINPGEGLIPQRDWPLKNYISVIKRLLENAKNIVVIVGASRSGLRTNEICSEVKSNRIINLCGETTIEELLTLFTIGETLIVSDSGLAHLASLTKIKQFVMFGPETPSVFSPLSKNAHIFYSKLPCSPCLSAFNHRKSCCTNNECLKTIDPKAVIEEIEKS